MPAFLRARDVNIILCYNQFGIHVFGFQGLVFMKRDKIKTQIMAYYIEKGYIAAMERGGSRTGESFYEKITNLVVQNEHECHNKTCLLTAGILMRDINV